MSNIHFIGGEKGGVGKSMCARLLAQYFIDRNIAFLGFDADQSHGTFSRFYADYASPLAIDSFASLDQMVDNLAQQNASELIIDLAAQTAKPLAKWINDSDALALLQTLGHKVYFWHLMDDGADSVQLLDKLLDQYPQSAIQFVVVTNYGRGENFSRFEQTPCYRKAQARNAQFLQLSKLQPALVQAIDFSNTSFWAAANNPQVMSTMERSRVRVWLNENYAQLDKLALQQDADNWLANPVTGHNWDEPVAQQNDMDAGNFANAPMQDGNFNFGDSQDNWGYQVSTNSLN